MIKSSLVHRMVMMIGVVKIVRFHQNGHGGQSGVAKTFEIFRNQKCLINNAYSSDSKTDFLMSQANRVLNANILFFLGV